MTYALCFYWLCAGLANHRLDRVAAQVVWAPLDFVLSLAFGGIAIPVRILSKLAE